MSILSLIKRAPKRTSAVVMMIALAIIVPATLFAWGPSRTTYTVANPAQEVTFNSITDNPNYGDERNFVTIKDASVTTGGGWADDITVQDGKEYTVRMYVHNNAAANLNLVATNVKASSNIPTYSAKSIQIDGYISSDNSNPKKIWDQVVLKSDKYFKVDYIEGSAKYYTNAMIGGAPLSDNVASSTGALLGYDKLDGKIPGCFQYTGVLSYTVKANVEKTPDFDIQKTVRVNGATDKTFKEDVTVNPGDKVDYQIYFKNTGETSLDNVIVKDILPAGVTYVPGTTYLHNSTGTKLVTDGITTGGLNVGGYAPTGDAYLKFTAQIAANSELPKCGLNTLKNIAKATTSAGTKEDKANTTVTRTCDENITVCELSTKKIVTIKNSQFDSKKYSKNLKDCETPDTQVVCELSTKQVITINKKDFDAKKHSTNIDDCKPPVKITVCEIATNAIVSIDESQFNSSKYSKDLSKCELPHTGPTENIVAIVGLGALIASIVYYVRSRSLQA